MTGKRNLTELEAKKERYHLAKEYIDCFNVQGQQFRQGLAAEKQRFEQLGNKTLKAMEDVMREQKKHSIWSFVKNLFSKQ